MGEVEVHALRQVTLALDEGQFVVLLGPSGSGKSTLLNIIGGLDVPTSGRVLYRDTDLTQADEGALTAYRRQHVGFVFQFYNLIPSLTAVENVALVTEISTNPMAPEDALRLVKLECPARSLSGAALGRRTAARRHCPGHRQAAVSPALRRAHWRARHLHRHRRARGPSACEHGARHHHRRHHPQRRDRVDGRPRRPPRRRSRHLRRRQDGEARAAGAAMVTIRLSALNRKLFRDLWGMKGQAFCHCDGRGGWRRDVRDVPGDVCVAERDTPRVLRAAAVRRRLRLAEARAPAGGDGYRGHPRRLGHGDARRLERDARSSGHSTSPPARGWSRSRPDRRPTVNDLFLRRGRWIEGNRPDEILASEGFVIANKLEIGDQVPAVINGRLRRLTIVGVALSPEFVYSIRPGELVPDDQRYGIFWMDQKALAAAFDMEGGFNDVVLALSPGASSEEVIARLDRILEPYGGLGAIPRALQLSHWTVQNELSQLQSFGILLPSIFLLVAAFILNVALTQSARASAAADRLAQSARLRQRGHRLALPEVGLRHRRRRHRHWRRRRRILRLDGHRPLQRLLPFSRAEFRRALRASSSALPC